jgi:hypothetical protein
MLSSQPSTIRRRPGVELAPPTRGGRSNDFAGLRMRMFNCQAKIAQLIAVLVVAAFSISATTMATYGADVEDGSIFEYQLKAAFVYNFAKFVQWPTETGGGSLDPFVLCVSGEEPFRIMHQYLTGKRIRGQLIAVRSVRASADLAGCHLLFVSAASGPLQRALPSVSGPVLTVGESEDFMQSGGMINLVRLNNRLHFEISRNAGERAGLKFSSQLLKLAAPVGDSLKGQ